MRTAIITVCAIGSLLTVLPTQAQSIPNPQIDYDRFSENVKKVAILREQRRISEAKFIEMAKDPNTIVLDARSSEKYRQLHIKGAKNLSLPDITAEELSKIIPNKQTRILIYCNNNFANDLPVLRNAFPTKMAATSLNIYTFNVLYGYGYTNVYELAPVVDSKTSKLVLVSSDRSSK